MNTDICPICKLKTNQTEIKDGYNIYNCNNCGKFEITPSASSSLDNDYKNNNV
jgi:predicted RNA-binding Zn-ribbon protein involved in translation (DUF1610 family)